MHLTNAVFADDSGSGRRAQRTTLEFLPIRHPQEQSHKDGHGTVNGVQCRVWRHQSVGMHARDLYLLADRLENTVPFGSLSNVRIVRNDG